MLSVTFIRHGESMDNLRSVWAGWSDAPLSNHGMNQARACGEYFSKTHFKAIYASTLKRAHQTAQAVHDAQPEPKPPLTTTPLIREQHFGIAEGQPWTMHQENEMSLEDQYKAGLFPVLYERDQKFPEGESLDDVQARAERAIDEFVLPHVCEMAGEGWKGAHIALVSHGLCISELVAALMRKGSSGTAQDGHFWKGLLNTAWTRVTVDIKGLQEGQAMSIEPKDLPPLLVKVTDVNQHSHLDNVKRQKGGIGSSAFDEKQTDIRSFFGGGAVQTNTTTPTEEGRSASNALDETIGED